VRLFEFKKIMRFSQEQWRRKQFQTGVAKNFVKYPFPTKLTTGEGGGCKWEIFKLQNALLPFRAELTTGGGEEQIEIFSGPQLLSFSFLSNQHNAENAR
jgi:hypothetical protein